MAEKKMTRAESLTTLIEIAEEWKAQNLATNDLTHVTEAIAIGQKMLDSIEKQKNRPKSKTSARIANEPIAREFIKKLATTDEPVNAKWMTYNVRFCTTPQKAVAIARIAEEWGAIEKVSIKNRTYYSKVESFEIPSEW